MVFRFFGISILVTLHLFTGLSAQASAGKVMCAISEDAKFEPQRFNFSEKGPIYPSSKNAKLIESHLSAEDFRGLMSSKIRGDWQDYTLDMMYDTQSKSALYLLGETHVKREENKKLGQQIVSKFRIRTIEGVSYENEMNCLSGPMKKIVNLYSGAGMILKTLNLKGSTILDTASSATQFKCNNLDELEAYKTSNVSVPLECGEFDNVPQGVCKIQGTPEEKAICQSYLIDRRNERMVKNLVSLKAYMPENDPILLVAGSKHIPGMADLFKKTGRFQHISECWVAQ